MIRGRLTDDEWGFFEPFVTEGGRCVAGRHETIGARSMPSSGSPAPAHPGVTCPRSWATGTWCTASSLLLTPGETHDSTAYPDLTAEHEVNPKVLLADRGCDSDAIRKDVRARGGMPEIPTKKNRRVQHSVDRPLRPAQPYRTLHQSHLKNAMILDIQPSIGAGVR